MTLDFRRFLICGEPNCFRMIHNGNSSFRPFVVIEAGWFATGKWAQSRYSLVTSLLPKPV